MLRGVSRSLQLVPALSTRKMVRSSSVAGMATEVTAAMVKQLRDLTGAPLMDCKHALSHPSNQGDLSKAVDWLRAKGISKVTASTRDTKEGLIGVITSADKVTMVEVNCETDFVGMNEDFQRFVAQVGESVSTKYTGTHASIPVAEILSSPLANKANATVEQALGDIVASIRETIVIKRDATFASPVTNVVISSYVHNKVGTSVVPANVQLGKSAGLVQFSVDGGNVVAAQSQLVESVGKKLAMHVVAAKPMFLDAASVPNDFLEKEKAIFKQQTEGEAAKKKPEVMEKIIQGRVSKRLSEVCLLGQNHVAEEGNPVVAKFVDTFSASSGSKVVVKDFAFWGLNQA